MIPVGRSFHFRHVCIFPSYGLYQWPCNKYKHCWRCCSFHIIILCLYSLKKQLLEVEWMQNGTAWRCSCSLSSRPSDVIPTGRTVWWIQLLWQLSVLLTSGFEFSSEGKERAVFHSLVFLPPAAGAKASANSHLNQHHANVLRRPKVTPTSGPTVCFFQVCHWAASAMDSFSTSLWSLWQ